MPGCYDTASYHTTACTPSTVIHSAEWVAYNHVQQLPSVSHQSRVNHSVTFVNLATGTHTE